MTLESELGPAVAIAGALAMYGLIFMGLEIAHRAGASGAATRRAGHLLGGGGAALAGVFFSNWITLGVVSGVIAVAMGVTGLAGRLKSVHVADKNLGGAIAYPLGIWIAFAIAGHIYPVFLAAVWAVTVGDLAAAIAGRHFDSPRVRIFDVTRSLAGSSAMALVSALGIAVVFASTGTARDDFALAVLVASVAASVAELLTPGGFDDLAVPVAVVAVLVPFAHG